MRLVCPCSTMAQMIVHGVFDRFPELRFLLRRDQRRSFPAQMYYMDRDYLEYNSWFQLDLPKLPSEYMREHALLRHGPGAAGGRDGAGDAATGCRCDHFWWGAATTSPLGLEHSPAVSRIHPRDA